ncbi:phosphoglucomutase [Thermus composti]|uniref:Phosphoglucomutase/phosphomannomutase family protein n=1 Tax=Thermus composti TaxID=532059 RepID=A0ABV6Q2V7_9DEIN|nr:phosphoglucomutase/phosphomannomutase family protein [Thermus composti]GGN00286.1 phosphoglucomutase [Thermus composti]
MSAPIRFGTEGFRGVIARDFTFATLHRLAEAYGRYLLERGGGLVVVGHDTRFLAGEFARALVAHLSGMGLKVALLKGPVPTPLLSFAVRHLGAVGGAMLTASHNPPQYLGVKFKDATGGPIAQEEAKAIEALVPEEASPKEGPVETLDLREAYYEALARLVDLKALAVFPGTLYHDSMGGAGAGFLKGFFRHVGLEIPVKPLREEPHPLFHGVNPEPIPKNLGVTQAVMSAEASPTFAVATDGDADRVGVVLPGGVFFNPHQVLTTLALYRFRKGLKGRAVKNFAVSWLLDRLGERLGFGVTTTPIGFKWIKEEFLKGDCFIGGEESGGVGYPEHLPERDGILSALFLVESVGATGKDLAEQFKEVEALAGLTHAYDRLDLPLKAPLDLSRLAEPKPLLGMTPVGVDTLDGVKWLYQEAWVLFRASGTEPVLRIYVEATDPGKVQGLLQEARRLVEG